MTVLLLHLLALSAKIALLGAVVWGQLFFLRRAPASSRSRLCALALVAIVVLIAGEAITPKWGVQGPRIALDVATIQATGTTASGASRLLPAIGWIWLAGAGLMLLRAVTGRVILRTVRTRSTAIDSAAGLDVRIADIQAPILWGFFRPAILLPAAARDWSPAQRAMVVTHELTHFRQGDVWTNLLAQVLRIVFWFHPVVWALVARLCREQELTCDEAVVASGHSPHDYAAFLLAVARGFRSPDLLACSMAGSGAKSMKQRFASLLDRRPRIAMTGRVATLVAAFALSALYLTSVQPVWSQAEARPYKMGPGMIPPKVLTKVEPEYTEEARRDKISGTVVLKLVVSTEGVAKDIEVVRGLDSGLDQKAIDALSKWTFQPAAKDGKAVPVFATIEIHFRLQ